MASMKCAVVTGPARGLTRTLPVRMPFSSRSCRVNPPLRPVSLASTSSPTLYASASDFPEPVRLEEHRSIEKIVDLGKWTMKFAAVMVVAIMMMMSNPSVAEAGRSGGRMGGSGFSRSMGSGSSMGMGMGSSRPMPSAGMAGTSSVNTIHHHHRSTGPIGFYPMGFYGGYGYGGGGGSIFTLIVLAIFAYVAINTVSGMLGSGDEEIYEEEEGREPMSVVKIQVGLLGTARDLQQDLNRMASSTDTSTPSGLHYLLQETVLSLRRNPQYAVYGKSELVKTRGLDNAEAKFNQVSMEERGKFDRETLSNFGGRKTTATTRIRGDGMNELIVITIIAAVDGKLEPEQINDAESLRANLNLLGSIPATRLLALEVLWTPQDEGDYFTREELVTDYPTLNTL